MYREVSCDAERSKTVDSGLLNNDTVFNIMAEQRLLKSDPVLNKLLNSNMSIFIKAVNQYVSMPCAKRHCFLRCIILALTEGFLQLWRIFWFDQDTLQMAFDIKPQSVKKLKVLTRYFFNAETPELEDVLGKGNEDKYCYLVYKKKKYRVQVLFYYFKDLDDEGICRVEIEVLNLEGGGQIIS